jgi:hypothetical protein
MSMPAAAAAERVQLVLPIEGMTCASCAGRVEQALRGLPGVEAGLGQDWHPDRREARRDGYRDTRSA